MEKCFSFSCHCKCPVSVLQEHTQKRRCWMFITATPLWTKHCPLYLALKEILAHSPLINSSMQCKGEQFELSQFGVNKTPAVRVLSWLAGWLAHFNKSMR